MPRSFTNQESETIRTLLLKSGEEMFSRYGLKKTSVEELARAAGIAKGSFYRFFPSKEALYFTCLERQERAFRNEHLLPLLETPRERRVIIEELVKLIFDLPEAYPLMTILFKPEEYTILLRGLPAEMLEAHRQGDEEAMDLIIRHLTAGAAGKEGSGETPSPEALNGLFWALVLLNLHRPELGPVFGPAADLIARTVSIGLDTILPQGDKS
jgi:AcrR family transcriptional regulator